MDDFNQFPIISLDEGLARVGNRKPLFARLLGTFMTNPRDDELLKAFESGDIEAAVMTLHTIKGVAANLSLTRLKKYAEALEIMFKKARDENDTGVFGRVAAEDAIRMIRETVNEAAGIIDTLK
ncbi:MAG: Hpt domain-containing protein [Defluviitaleaceae bacterium]|nr:Hpt domain-containing protein [Defluviitaleaceae bacterium]MCL2836593.1 Hpt domain-containing protein [Defluviitaleaceae bacterium]